MPLCCCWLVMTSLGNGQMTYQNAKGKCYGYQTHLNSIYQKEFYKLSMHDQRTWESEFIPFGKSSNQFATNIQRGRLLLKINLKWHPFGISGLTVSYGCQKGTLHSLW